VHIQKPYDLPLASLLKSRGAGKIVFGCHGTDFFPGDRRVARNIDIAVSCSAFNASQIRDHFGLNPRVVYNGIDPDVFHPLSADAELRRELAGNAPTILYVGRLVRWKGAQHLIQATAKMSKSRAVNLLIAGVGEYRATLEQQARDHRIGAAVKFLGYIPPHELPRYYAIADVVALASYANETFSISTVEAMACGRATVGTNFGGIPEVIADGQTGFLAEPENPNDLAEKISRLLDDAPLRARFGECGRQRAGREFTWDKVTDRLLSAYRELT
jgi:glycosyltransferase involved in cell wall biosynthesis